MADCTRPTPFIIVRSFNEESNRANLFSFFKVLYSALAVRRALLVCHVPSGEGPTKLLAEDGTWNAKHSLARNIARERRPAGLVVPHTVMFCRDLTV